MRNKLKLVSLFALIATLLFVASTQAQNPNTDSAAPAMQKSHRLIVELNSDALAVWANGESSARATNGHLNLNARAAQNYLAQLQTEQRAFVSNMKAALPSATVSSYINESGAAKAAAYQVTFNGLAIDPGMANVEAARQALLKVSGVKNVYYDFAHYPSLYTSTALINAPMVWNSAAVGGQANGGKGVKVASMDGGLHKDAAMFSGVGWSYPAGWPQGGLGLSANNNGKIIASRAYFRNWDPPAAGDENPWPGENGTEHGTHTGSTAAGNIVTATSAGFNVGQMSGVAPGAWVMSYRVFYASVEGNASFFTAEGIAALEDIVKDGADVVNNSWGEGPTAIGGEFDSLDMALINAHRSGVFVSLAGGNAGPGEGTMDHPSADYIDVAASTTSGTLASGRVNVTKPTPISETLQGLAYAAASFGAPLPVGVKVSYPYVVPSTNIIGCNPGWPEGSFTGKAVLISRGTCEFGEKVLNAERAGATFAIVYNSAAGGEGFINMGEGAVGSQVTISSIFVQRSSGLNMIAWQAANPAAEFEIDTVAFQQGETPDQIIAFSSRGPAAGNVLKPDIAAPGVNILAQGYTPGAKGEARHLGYGQASGTSMASPHVAGAAALLKQLYPKWTNAAIKSAMMSTSKYMEIYNYDETPAQPLDMGAGRLDVGAAMDPGVILDPPSLSYGLVPTGTTKSISVKVTNITNASETYNISTLYTGKGFTQTTALPGFSGPASVTIGAGETKTVEVKFDSAAGQGLGHNQGYIVMTGSTHKAHMPAWAQVTHATNLADVLIIDADLSGYPELGFSDYIGYYTQTLTALGHSYKVWDVVVENTAVPDTTTLFAYKGVILYTGNNLNVVFTQADMDNLTHYINNGGVFIAMGQDLAATMGADATNAGVFLFNTSLGANWLQDSVTARGIPNLPIIPAVTAPPALQKMSLNLGDPTMYLGGATLSGANEVPPVTTTMTGQLDLAYNLENGVLDYLLQVNVTEPITVTAAYIHNGAMGVNGGVLIRLHGTPRLVTNTFRATGSGVVSADVATAMMAGNTYVNVRTNLNPSGEVRGQVVLAATVGDGAGNQGFIDEIRPLPPRTDVGDPNTPEEFDQYTGLFVYPGSNNVEGGFVAMANRAQPSLESPGISYWGRSILTTFGLEGVHGAASRAALIQGFLNWGMDNPTVTISNTTTVTDANSELMRFEASMGSNVAGATGWMYRWNFGDGSPMTPWFDTTHGSRNYPVCGTYTVWAEGKNVYGNRAIGKLQNITINKTNCGMVGAAGGTVNGTNVKGLPVTIQVPAGVLADGSSLVYAPGVTSTHAMPTDVMFAGQTFDLNLYNKGVMVENARFNPTITVTMGYTDSNVMGLNESALTLRYWNGQAWSSDGITVVSRDVANNRIVFAISHLSEFAFFAPAKSAGIYLPIIRSKSITTTTTH